MLLSFFIFSVLSKNPIILVPGTMGSVLYGNINLPHTHWYCPKNVQNELIWLRKKFVIPPMINCIADWMTLIYNEKLGEPVNRPGVNIDIFDFGGIDGISFIDEEFLGVKIIPYFSDYIEYLQKNGYIVGKTLFGCPFDWRKGLALGNEYWNKMISLVEKAYNLNNEKVVLVGHSLGGNLIHYFLSEKTTPEWREKYIESSILVAPSFGGSGFGFVSVIEQKIAFLELIGEEKDMGDLLSSLGGLHVHFLNQEIFGNTIVSYDYNEKPLTAKDFKKVCIENLKFNNNSLNLFKLNENRIIKAPQALDVPTAIIYNDALPCLRGINLKTKEKLYGKGDFIVNAEGYHYACNNWKSNKKLFCHNINSTSFSLNHISMVSDKKYVKFVLDLAMNNKWQFK